MEDYTLILGTLALFLLVIIGGGVFYFSRVKNQNKKNLKLDIILIKIPKYTRKEKEELSKEYIQNSLGKIENLFTAVAGLKAAGSRETFSLEMVSRNGFINFYAAVPPHLKEYFIQQLQAVYPKIYFEETGDYNIFQANSNISAGILKFSSDFSLPIKTYKTFETDPLESISNSLSKLSENESAAVQYIFKSAPRKWHQRGRKIAQAMQKGEDYQHALASANSSIGVAKVFNFIFSFITPSKPKEEPSKPQVGMSAMEQERAKGMEQKTSKSGLDVNVRIIVSSKDPIRSQAYLVDIINSYTQYNIYEFGNSFKADIPKKPDKIINDFIYRSYDPRHRLLLNSEEMVSIMHLPLPTSETPNIDWLEAVKAPPPSNMPKDGIILGVNTFRGKSTYVRIKDDDRRRHMYEIGQTGTGKSVFMESLIKQDIEAGHGVCVVDPHGELVEKILTHVPKERAEDVIIFDPADTSRPMAMNMLEFSTQDQKTFVINEMINIFDKLYDLKATGGPMFEQYMRNAMLLIMDDPESGATLLEIPKVLADENYRRAKLAKVKNDLVKDFWEKEAQKAGGEASLANMVPYITSKLTPFITNDTIRPIISQQKSAFNFRQAMDEDKIILINLSKGKIGEMNSNLLGMVVVGKLLYAAMSRVDIPEEERHDFYLYIDEFQNFLTDSISIILSEARKYKLNLILAHQFIAQLVKGGDTRIRDAIFGNVGTIISYRIGVEDAEVIAKQMAPVVSEYDLVNMPKYTCYIRLLVDNQNPPAFNFQPILPEKGNYELAKAIKELSRLKYGRDRNAVENEIKNRMLI
ncbi:type IV secretory system conjugative DNA transfer family protein [Candidatus Parcubacteria bacterium]|nr:MAG: type IV secretory system conjugative DNA transfer family protein [Candidatus Parcubacteria bacterium]